MNSRCNSVSHGTATATVGTDQHRGGGEVGGGGQRRGCSAAPPRRRTRSTVVGPPAASAPDGVRPDAHATSARARGVGPAARTAASSASISIEQPDGVQRAGAADESRERGVHRGEHLEHQVVTGPQMGALVA